jgi:hypothetical protein
MTDAMMTDVRALVAQLRGEAAPMGGFYHYIRSKQPRDAA